MKILNKKALPILAMLGISAIFGTHGYAATQSGYTSGQIVKANEVLQAGTVIPATLLTTIVSDNMSTPIISVVRQNVYDSVTGENLLIPAGSKLIGEAVGFTGTRINLSFHRVIFPNGHNVELPDYGAIDGVGQSGIKDKYTTHSWQKIRGIFSGSILASVLSSVSKASKTSSQTQTSSSNGTSTGYSNTQDESPAKEALRLATAEMLKTISDQTKQNADIPPTGTIREGYQFNIMLGTDIRIRPYTR